MTKITTCFEDCNVPDIHWNKKKNNHTTKQNSRNKHLRIWTLHNSVLKCFINILRQVYQNLGMFNFKLPILITPEVMAVSQYRVCLIWLKSLIWLITLKAHTTPKYIISRIRWHSTFKCQCFCTVFWSSFFSFQRIT